MSEELSIKTQEEYLLDIGYPGKVWIKTIFLISPLLIAIATLLSKSTLESWANELPVLVVIILFSIVMSLPTLACTYLVFWICFRSRYSPLSVKIICGGTSLLGVAISFTLLGGQLAFFLMVVYSASTLVACMIQKVRLC